MTTEYEADPTIFILKVVLIITMVSIIFWSAYKNIKDIDTEINNFCEENNMTTYGATYLKCLEINENTVKEHYLIRTKEGLKFLNKS
jgi:hypothetical protein